MSIALSKKERQQDIMGQIARLATDLVSDTPLSVEDTNQRIGYITQSAGVADKVVRDQVREHANRRLNNCGHLPLKNEAAYISLS